MPIYQYRCRCGNTDEQIKSYSGSDDDRHVCKICGDRMARVMGGVMAQFIVPVFYCNDKNGGK